MAEINVAELAAQDALNPQTPSPLPRAIHTPLAPAKPGGPAPDVARLWIPAGPAPQIPSPSPLTNFSALDDSGAFIPPDTHGGVGRSHVMTTINDRYRIQDRAGTPLLTISIDGFWSSTGATGVFDPRTVFDPFNDRWIATAVSNAASPSASVLVGVSFTGDPTGTWRLVRFDADAANSVFADFPTLGFNRNWIAIGLNMFTNAGSFVRAEVYALDYPRARATDITGSRFVTTSSFTLQPAVTHSATENTLYLVAAWDNVGATYKFHTLTGSAASPVLSGATTRTNPLGAWQDPRGDILPQLGSLRGLHSFDDRIGTNSVFRNGSIWYAQTVGLAASGSAAIQRTAAQWVQVDTTGRFLQGGRIVDSTATPSNGGFWFAYPSIAVNAANDVLIGFSRFSSTTFASAGYAYRAASDPAGTMRDPVVFKAGEANYIKTFGGVPNRWGDYSAAMVDPLNDTDFWTIQQYARLPIGSGPTASRWGTWWARVSGSSDTDHDLLPDSWELQFGLDPGIATGANGAAGDPDGDGLTNLQEFQRGRHPRGFFTRFFAEGATGSFFDTFFALANPDSATTARVNLFFLPSMAATTNLPLTVGPSSRATVNPETAVSRLAAAEFSTVVESDIPIVADRTMKWGTAGYGAHAETSVAGPATRWFFAEGATHSGFDLFYLLQNPNVGAATVTVTYLLDSGAPVTQTLSVPGNSRHNIWVDTVAGLSAANISAVIDSSVPIIAERAMYLNLPGQPFGAGHESAGVTAAANNWFFAEGATGAFFDLFILVANPNAAAATVTANYLLEGGIQLTKVHTVPGNSRYNIHVDGDLPQLADVAVSTAITSSQPVVVERSMWWPGPTAATWNEAHNSAGATTTGTRWALAEGEVGNGIDTFVLIANTSAFTGSARVTSLYESGAPEGITMPLPANSRTNVDVRSRFPASAGRRFGVLVESLGTTPAQIVVERAMYMNAAGVFWAAGTSALATRQPPSPPPTGGVCDYLLTSAKDMLFGPTGGNGVVTFTRRSGDCTWSAGAVNSWISLNTSGEGDIRISFTVSPHSGSTERESRIEVRWPGTQAGENIRIIQSASPSTCAYGLTSAKTVSFGNGGGSGTVTFNLTSGSCTWVASSTEPSWLSVLDASGTGNISIRYTVAPNSAGIDRQGQIQVRWPGPQAGENILIAVSR